MAASSNTCGCDDAQCDVCEMPRPDICPECGGHMRPGIIDQAIHQNRRVLLITDIPAAVCGQCGSGYFDVETMGFLENQWEAFFTGDPDQCLVEEYRGGGNE